MKSEKGVVIAGISMPGAGKSSLFREIASLRGKECFLEPEENEWGNAVKKRMSYKNGEIAALHWFRSCRVPQLYQARKLADAGETVFVDSIYDKICYYYLGKSGIEWLIKADNPYFENFKETARLDLELLPDVDVLVVITVNQEDWLDMLKIRARFHDNVAELEKTFHSQKHFVEAARDYSKSRNIEIIYFENTYGDLIKSANLLIDLLIEKGVRI